MSATDIVELALACYRDPLAHQCRFALTEPLPAGLEQLLVLAHGAADALADAARQSGAPPAEVQDAARFLLQQLCFAPGASHYRVLGLEPGASIERIKERHRRLMWLFHPDRAAGRETSTDGYAARLNDSWYALSRPASRQRYDAGLSPTPPTAGAVAPYPLALSAFLHGRRRWPDASRTRYPQRRRWLPILVLGGCTLVAVLLVGTGHLMRPAGGPLVYAAAPVAPAAISAPDRAVREAESQWAREQRERIAATVAAAEDKGPAVAAQAPEQEPEERLPLAGLRQERALSVPREEPGIPNRPERARVPPASPLLVVPVGPVSQAAKPKVDRTPDNAPLTDREVEHLISRYTHAYQRADLNALMTLFAPGTRDRDGSDLRGGYAETFQAYMIRGLLLHDLRWDLHGETANVFAGYELSLRQRNNGQLSQLAGTLRLKLHKRADGVVIEAIDYQWRAN